MLLQQPKLISRLIEPMAESNRFLFNLLIPGLFTIGGILFLILALTRTGSGQVASGRGRFAVVGVFLLIAGASLYIVTTGLYLLASLNRTPPVAAAAGSPTATSRAAQTLLPAPTITASSTAIPPISSVMGQPVRVLFEDTFDKARLSVQWEQHGIEPSFKEGRLIFTGVNRWGDLIARWGIDENEGVLTLFRFSGGQMEMYLETDTFGAPGYRRWGLMRHGSSWEIAGMVQEQYQVHGTVRLLSWTWYYLLMRVGSDGRFYMQLWERDDPSTYVVNLVRLPPGGQWDDRFWRYVAQVHSGTLELDFYQELQFPDGYQSPETPPQGDSAA